MQVQRWSRSRATGRIGSSKCEEQRRQCWCGGEGLLGRKLHNPVANCGIDRSCTMLTCERHTASSTLLKEIRHRYNRQTGSLEMAFEWGDIYIEASEKPSWSCKTLRIEVLAMILSA